MKLLCWFSCMVFALLWTLSGDPAGAAAFFAASFVILSIETKRT